MSAWTPIEVALECQGYGRVTACEFVRAALDDLDVIAVVPRARAEVVLYLDVTTRQNDDLWLLRAVSEVEGAPAAYEQVAIVDTRAPVDEQLDAFVGPVNRVLGPFVAIRLPEAVTVELTAPPDDEAEARRTSPYGWSAWGGGWGSWTAGYQYLSAWGGMSVSRTTARSGAAMWATYNRDIQRQPALQVRGHRVPLGYDAESVDGAVHGEVNLDEHWTVGALGRWAHQDQDGQYLATGRVHLGLERNWFASDDPRGNRLALLYLVGAQADWYHQANVLGETEAVFPTHMALVQGEVQFDTVELSVDLAAQSELLHPDRRYVLSTYGSGDFAVGGHLDLSLSLGVTRQAIPGPAAIDRSDFEQVKRASYAEPLEMEGSLSFRVHFDPTNGARNNRFDAVDQLESTDNL